MDGRPTYQYLLEKPGGKVIQQRYQHMEERAMAFLSEAKLTNTVQLNHGILNVVILDYFADIERLKAFEEIERANKNKISAYMAYWWLRRKPLQVIKDDVTNEHLVYVNEEFIATLLTKDFLATNTQKLLEIEQCNRFIDHILYHLKYRIYTPQTLELMLMATDTGIEIGKVSP